MHCGPDNMWSSHDSPKNLYPPPFPVSYLFCLQSVLSCYVIMIFEVAMKLQAQGGCHFSGRRTGFCGLSSITGLSAGESDRALWTCGFRLRIWVTWVYAQSSMVIESQHCKGMCCLNVQGWSSPRRMRFSWLVFPVLFGVKLPTTTWRYRFLLFMWFLFINYSVMNTCNIYTYAWFLHTLTAIFYLLEYTSITCNYTCKSRWNWPCLQCEDI